MSFLSTLLSRFGNLLVWWIQIMPWERALRIRLGKHITELKAGIHLRIPVVDRFYVQTDRLRTCDLTSQTISTADGHTLTIAGIIRYRIADLKKLYLTLHHPETTLVDMAAAEVARFVASSNKNEVTPVTLQLAVNEVFDLTEYGLAEGRLNVTDFAYVRTYRLLQDSRYSYGDSLNTNGGSQVGFEISI